MSVFLYPFLFFVLYSCVYGHICYFIPDIFPSVFPSSLNDFDGAKRSAVHHSEASTPSLPPPPSPPPRIPPPQRFRFVRGYPFISHLGSRTADIVLRLQPAAPAAEDFPPTYVAAHYVLVDASTHEQVLHAASLGGPRGWMGGLLTGLLTASLAGALASVQAGGTVGGLSR